MKKALGLWLILFALIIGGVFFFLMPEKNAAPVNSNTGEKQIISTREDAIKYFHVNQITSDLKGQTIVTSGVVGRLSEKKNIVFFTLKDVAANREIKCVMFGKTNSDNAGRKALLEKSEAAGLAVYLEGEVDIYKGDLEIKVWKVFTK